MGKDLLARAIPCPGGATCQTLSGQGVEPGAEEEAIPQPKEDIAISQLKEDTAFPQPKEDIAIPRPKEDTAIPQPREDIAIPQPKENTAIPQPKEDTAIPQPKEDTAISQPKEDTAIPQPNAIPQANGLPNGESLPKDEKAKGTLGQPAGAANDGQPCPDGMMGDSAGNCPKPAANEEMVFLRVDLFQRTKRQKMILANLLAAGTMDSHVPTEK